MKKIKFLSWVMLLSVALTSCSDAAVDEEPDPTNPPTDEETMSFTASAEGDQASSAQSLSRTELQNATGEVWWSQGDSISLFLDVDNSATGFTTGITEASQTAEFTGSLFTNSEIYYALYPHDTANSSDYTNETISFTTLATQSYNGANFAQGAFPAVASSNDSSTFSFTNLYGGIQFALLGSGTVTSISVSTTDDQVLCGVVTVDMSASTPEVTSIANGGTTVTLDCGEGVVLDGVNTAYFTIALPPTSDTSSLSISMIVDSNTINDVVEYNVKRNTVGRNSFNYIVDGTEGTMTQYYSLSIFGEEGVYYESGYPADDTWVVNIDSGSYTDLITVMDRAKAATSNNVSLKLVTSNSTALTASAFKDCTSLGTLDISAFDTVPASFAQGATSLTSVILNETETSSIGGSAFNGCTSLSTITNSDKVLVLSGSAFASCSSADLTEANFSSVTSVGDSAFASCTNLTSIDLSSATTFGASVINSCNKLETVDFSAAGNFTCDAALFQGVYARCTSDITLVLNPDKCETPTSATPAADMTNLTWLTNSGTPLVFKDITYEGKGDGGDVDEVLTLASFADTYATSGYPADDTWVVNIDSGSYDDLITVMDRAKTATSNNVSLKLVTSNSTALTASAFKDCTSLGTLDISAFDTVPASFAQGATSLTSVILNETETSSIGGSAFNGCTSLSTITNSDKVLVLSGSAFASCSSTELTEANFSSVTSVGDSAFASCTNLTSIDLSSATTFGASVINSCNKLETVDFSAAGNFTCDAALFQGVYDRCGSGITLTLNYDKCDGGSVTPQADMTALTWLTRGSGGIALVFKAITYDGKDE